MEAIEAPTISSGFSCHQRTSGRFLLGEAESPRSSSRRDWEVGGREPPEKQNVEKKKSTSKQSIKQKCMTAKFKLCFCDGNDRPFASVPLPHICLRPLDFQRLGSHQ